MGRVLDIYIFGGVFIGWTSGWTHKYRREGRKRGRVGILHLPLHLIHKFSSHSPKHLSLVLNPGTGQLPVMSV